MDIRNHTIEVRTLLRGAILPPPKQHLNIPSFLGAWRWKHNLIPQKVQPISLTVSSTAGEEGWLLKSWRRRHLAQEGQQRPPAALGFARWVMMLQSPALWFHPARVGGLAANSIRFLKTDLTNCFSPHWGFNLNFDDSLLATGLGPELSPLLSNEDHQAGSAGLHGSGCSSLSASWGCQGSSRGSKPTLAQVHPSLPPSSSLVAESSCPSRHPPHVPPGLTSAPRSLGGGVERENMESWGEPLALSSF